MRTASSPSTWPRARSSTASPILPSSSSEGDDVRAAVLTEDRPRLELADVPTPTRGPGEALLRVTGCGICGSDLHLASQLADAGAVLGPELAGEIPGLGAAGRGTGWA